MVEVSRGPSSVDIRCDTAFEFLTLLDPFRGLFTSGEYIFRGVDSEVYGLLPAAHRSDAPLYVSETEASVGPAPEVHKQCMSEFHTLDRFFTIVSRNGIAVPEDSYILRDELDDWRKRFRHGKTAALDGRVWPSARLFSLLGLAQHFGIPTRALDWTFSAQVAAYFAARPALDKPPDDLIAVWAIDDFARQVDHMLDITTERPLRVFTLSGAENDNLRAQRGLFMLHPQRLSVHAEPFYPREYSELLRDSMPIMKDALMFFRVLVVRSEAGAIVDMLARAGITAGALYPGLWGAAREYADERRFPRSWLNQPRTLDAIGVWDRIHKIARGGDA